MRMFTTMTGRKPLYNPETLEIGGKMELFGKAKEFHYQYIYQARKRAKGKFKISKQGKKVFIERVA